MGQEGRALGGGHNADAGKDELVEHALGRGLALHAQALGQIGDGTAGLLEHVGHAAGDIGVGEGTAQMSRMAAGGELDLLTGLGNGFDVHNAAQRPLLVGGGVGVPPLYNLAKVLLAAGKRVGVVLGFNTADEVFYADEFRALGCDVDLATADGSAGVRGFVTTAIAECRPEFDYFYACGPLPMLRALCDAVQQDGQLSFEERMGCGFGACMGCSCKTKYGNKRICKEGPVLTKGEVIW